MFEGVKENYSHVRDWVVTALGAPAILLAIEKLDDRLDLFPILERIVIGHTKISHFIWVSIGNLIGLDFSRYHGILTLISLYFLSWYMSQKTLSGDDNFSFRRNRAIELFSIVLIYAILIGAADESGALFTIIYAIVFYFILLLIFFKGSQKRYIRSEIALVSFFIFLIFILFYYVTSDAGIVLALISGMMLTYTVRFVGLDTMYFTRIIVFCAGVFTISFVANVGIPWVNALLEQIGV